MASSCGIGGDEGLRLWLHLVIAGWHFLCICSGRMLHYQQIIAIAVLVDQRMQRRSIS